MLKYIGKKVLIALATIFVLATATFFLMKLIPGDPFLNDKIPIAVQDKQRAFYGLDKPVPQQYLTYMNNLLHGDLGYSIKKTGKTVVDIIKEAFPVSAELGLISLFFAEAVGLLFGILCAQFRGKWPDYLLMVVAVLGIALPSMVLGPILRMIFGVKLGILPVTGWGKPNQIILPALVLGLGTVAGNTRNMRASMLAITTQDYVKTARAKGLSPVRVVLKHQFKNFTCSDYPKSWCADCRSFDGLLRRREHVFNPGTWTLFCGFCYQPRLPAYHGSDDFLRCIFGNNESDCRCAVWSD